MADIYTTLADAQASLLVRERASGNLLTGKMVYARGQFTTTSTTAAADVLYIAKLPAGAVVVPGASFIDTEDCGTDINITIGDDDPTADADRYSTAISLGTAGRIAFVPGVAGPNPHALSQESWIKGVLADAGSISVTAGKDFTVWIAYILP
jgi:hypothetical protein